jgi:two-component system, OmpR family, sensor histidine kinase ChvG
VPVHAPHMDNAARGPLAEAPLAAGLLLSRLQSAAARLVNPLQRAFEAVGTTRLGRFLSSSLLRRIVMSNLLGLTILFAGAMYLSQFNVWLIDSKRESLQVRALTIAKALASDATIATTKDIDGTPSDGTAFNPFADLEFSLDPIRVAQTSRQLLSDTKNRARVYDLSATLVHDSQRTMRPDTREEAESSDTRSRSDTKNLLTRMTQRLLRSDLRVYKDPGHGNAGSIREIRHALDNRQTSAFVLLTSRGRQIVSIATPIQRAGSADVSGVLVLSTHHRDIDDAVEEQRNVVIGFAILALAAAMIASYMLARTVAGPMQELSEVAEAVTRNIHAAAKLPEFKDREDEVGQMARAFKMMTAALYRRIEASEKFAADVAHELKNPLAAAKSTAEAFDYAKTDEQRDQLVKQIQHEIERLNKLITDVSNASRLDAELMRQRGEPVDVADVAQNIVTTFSDLLSDTEKSVKLDFDESAHLSGAYMILGQAGRIGQVLTNLVDNALSFSPPTGTVHISIRRDCDYVLVAVEDEGPGIDPDQLDKIFQRFYTYRPTALSSRGNNSGLGLSISREIVEVHHGEIWAENRAAPDNVKQEASKGARFVIRLPAADSPAIAAPRRRGLSRLITRKSQSSHVG